MADTERMQQDAAQGRSNRIQKLTNIAGAAVSLALIVGIGVWGYRILVRDVSGVPVVQAVEGPMRIQPEDPGGQQARHQGLAVNEVAAQGTAAKPADRLVLAPEPLDLSVEDKPLAEMRPQTPRSRTAPEAGAHTGTTADTVAASAPAEASPTAEANERAPAGGDETSVRQAALQLLADELSEGVAPIEGVAQDEPEQNAEQNAAQDLASSAEPDVAATPVPASAGAGLVRSLRPKQRPAGVASVEEAVAQAVAAKVTPASVDPADIPAGTRMAQLGAFASPEVAEDEWDRLAGRFDEYLAEKSRVIQKAQSGGRTFYRLRAMGFDDLSDARRFCSALVAENAECIPVVTR